MRACIADDDVFVLVIYGILVEKFGYEVATFQSGESLLTYLHTHPDIDLVIIDYQMPGKDGLEVLKVIRDAPKLKHLPVVVHTATRDLKARVENAGGIFAVKGGKPSLDDVLESLR